MPTNVDYFDIPRLAADLVEELDRRFPPLRPTPTTTLSEIMFDAGRRQLIDLLLERKRTQDASNVLTA